MKNSLHLCFLTIMCVNKHPEEKRLFFSYYFAGGALENVQLKDTMFGKSTLCDITKVTDTSLRSVTAPSARCLGPPSEIQEDKTECYCGRL